MAFVAKCNAEKREKGFRQLKHLLYFNEINEFSHAQKNGVSNLIHPAFNYPCYEIYYFLNNSTDVILYWQGFFNLLVS